MRLALVLLVALALPRAGEARQRPGPTPLVQGVSPGGLAFRAREIPLDRKVKSELRENAPPRSRAPVLKGGRMRPLLSPGPTTTPPQKEAAKRP
jgi:hypothetical protein